MKSIKIIGDDTVKSVSIVNNHLCINDIKTDLVIASDKSLKIVDSRDVYTYSIQCDHELFVTDTNKYIAISGTLEYNGRTVISCAPMIAIYINGQAATLTIDLNKTEIICNIDRKYITLTRFVFPITINNNVDLSNTSVIVQYPSTIILDDIRLKCPRSIFVGDDNTSFSELLHRCGHNKYVTDFFQGKQNVCDMSTVMVNHIKSLTKNSKQIDQDSLFNSSVEDAKKMLKDELITRQRYALLSYSKYIDGKKHCSIVLGEPTPEEVANVNLNDQSMYKDEHGIIAEDKYRAIDKSGNFYIAHVRDDKFAFASVRERIEQVDTTYDFSTSLIRRCIVRLKHIECDENVHLRFSGSCEVDICNSLFRRDFSFNTAMTKNGVIAFVADDCGFDDNVFCYADVELMMVKPFPTYVKYVKTLVPPEIFVSSSLTTYSLDSIQIDVPYSSSGVTMNEFKFTHNGYLCKYILGTFGSNGLVLILDALKRPVSAFTLYDVRTEKHSAYVNITSRLKVIITSVNGKCVFNLENSRNTHISFFGEYLKLRDPCMNTIDGADEYNSKSASIPINMISDWQDDKTVRAIFGPRGATDIIVKLPLFE